MTAFYDFFRFIKLYSTDGTTLEHTIEADAVTDTLNISRGAGVSWTPASSATDSFKIDVNYNLEVPVGTTTLRLTDVHSVDQDIALHAGGNMTITRNNSGSITIAALMGGVSKVITLATQTNPVVITTNTAHDYTEGTPVTIVDVVGMTDLNGNEYYANVLTSNTLALYTDEGLATSLDGTGFGAYTSGGVVTGEYAGAKKLNDLVDVKFNAPNFTNSIKIGDTTTGTLNNADGNVIIGVGAYNTITTADDNVIVGYGAGANGTTGAENVIIGKNAHANSSAVSSVIIGKDAASGGGSTDNVYRTVIIGTGSGSGNAVTGNVAIGYNAGKGPTDNSNENVAIGTQTIQYVKGTGGATSTYNVAIGNQAMKGVANVSTNDHNVAIGTEALTGATTGSKNVAIGYQAGMTITDGSNNVIIGNYAGTSSLADTVALYTGGGTERLTITSSGATINSKDVILDGAVTTHLIPDTNITYDLGSATHKFRDLYLDGSSIHLGSTILRDDGSGNLQANLTNILEIAADDSTIRTINSGESIKFIGAGSVSTATDAEGNLTITGDYGGLTDNTNVDAVVAGDDGKILYYDHGTTSFKWKADDDTPAGYNNTDWDTAYGWGDHTVPGYLTGTGVLSSHTDVHNAVPTAGQVLMWDDGNSRWAPGTDFDTDLTGSVFGDDSTVLVDGVNNSINLDGTVKGHIIPDTDDTYDIGSATYKIRDLYLGSNSLHIGDTGTIGITADVMTVAGATGGFKAVAFTGNSGVAIDEFSTDGTLAGNSDTAVPTEKAVKTYVDLGTNPTGSIIAFAGITAPTGWLLCYGQAVLRTTYADLFAVFDTIYGVGDGSTTFNIPDLRGRTIAGQDDMGSVSADRLTGAGGIGGIDGDVLGSSGGAETVTLTESQIPAHEHSYNYSPDTGDTNNTTGIDVSGGSSAATTGTTGGGAAHVNIQPTLILNYIIKT